MKGEKLAIARDRVIMIVMLEISGGKEISVRIERVVDGYIWRRGDVVSAAQCCSSNSGALS